jgi:osmotically-inducible protein OsmY
MRWIALLLMPLLVSGCVAVGLAATTEGGKAIADERSFGRQVDDAGIYTKLNERFANKDMNDLFVNVTINVRHARVMLTGNVNKTETAQLATELAWQVKGVQEVINEITVDPNKKFWNNANDALIKKNLEARLLVTKGVWVVNYSIDIISGTAYLLGVTQDQAELERVLNIARTTRGVRRVISHLKLKTELGTTPPEQPAIENQSSNPPVGGNGSYSEPGYGAAPAPAPVYSGTAPAPTPVYTSPDIVR